MQMLFVWPAREMIRSLFNVYGMEKASQRPFIRCLHTCGISFTKETKWYVRSSAFCAEDSPVIETSRVMVTRLVYFLPAGHTIP